MQLRSDSGARLEMIEELQSDIGKRLRMMEQLQSDLDKHLAKVNQLRENQQLGMSAADMPEKSLDESEQKHLLEAVKGVMDKFLGRDSSENDGSAASDTQRVSLAAEIFSLCTHLGF